MIWRLRNDVPRLNLVGAPSNPRCYANRTQLIEVMRLLNTETGRLQEFHGEELSNKSYAILSHTWLDNDADGNPQEVLFHGLNESGFDPAAWRKAGFQKIQKCCEQARLDNLIYIWIDTCCIDKRSSAELSEAINSMFTWYSNAQKCYVYLEDWRVSEGKTAELQDCRWFKRGWTLQELIAAKDLTFFDEDWIMISELSGTRDVPLHKVKKLSQITGIKEKILGHKETPATCSVPERMTWAAERQTTRPEDVAYSLLGILGVSIPILYGEGAREAFRRLQIEHMLRYRDHSLFAWRVGSGRRQGETIGLLASCPADFKETYYLGGEIRPSRPFHPYEMTNIGLSITLPIHKSAGEVIGILDCWGQDGHGNTIVGAGIYLKKARHSRPQTKIYTRVRCSDIKLFWDESLILRAPYKSVYIQERPLDVFWS